MTVDKFEAAQGPKFNFDATPDPTGLQAEYLDGLIPNQASDSKKVLMDGEIDGSVFSPTERPSPFDSNANDMERWRHVSVLADSVVQSLTSLDHIRQTKSGSGSALDEFQRVEANQNIERAFQAVSQYDGDRSSPDHPIQTLVRTINQRLQAEGSPHVFMPATNYILGPRDYDNPLDREPMRNLDFRSFQTVDTNTGKTVERFDLAMNPALQNLADRLNRQLSGDGRFGNEEERSNLERQLRILERRYRSDGIHNFVNRLHNPDYRVNIMDLNNRGDRHFGGLSISPRRDPKTFSDVLWLHR